MPVPAPWARPGSGFTLLFEAWAVEMARHLPVLLQCLFDRFGSVFP